MLIRGCVRVFKKHLIWFVSLHRKVCTCDSFLSLFRPPNHGKCCNLSSAIGLFRSNITEAADTEEVKHVSLTPSHFCGLGWGGNHLPTTTEWNQTNEELPDFHLLSIKQTNKKKIFLNTVLRLKSSSNMTLITALSTKRLILWVYRVGIMVWPSGQ